MSASPNPAGPMTDVFSRFWTDFMNQAAVAGFAPPTVAPDATKHFQRIFFDALAKYADDFMRSPQFLQMLKQTMDGALSMRQQVNDFMAKAMNASQLPSRQDSDHMIQMLHGLERRIAGRLDELSDRMSNLENGKSSRPGPSAPARKPAARKSRAATR